MRLVLSVSLTDKETEAPKNMLKLSQALWVGLGLEPRQAASDPLLSASTSLKVTKPH